MSSGNNRSSLRRLGLEPSLKKIYGQSLSLLTDLYQLSMAAAYWNSGTADKQAVFELYFRNLPFRGGYAVSCGLAHVIEFIESFCFTEDDLAYLATLKAPAQGTGGGNLFSAGFLDFLRNFKLKVSVHAVEEGRLVFAHEPLIRVSGPILHCQLLETALLNITGFQCLVATKAARVKSAAGIDQVTEFGLRRAQGIDGSLAASRAAFIGGVDATSNVLAGKLFGIPVRGTHAHSWVMSFPGELDAFMAYARAMPENSVFLVDTYNTREGIKNAIKAGLWLKDNGHIFIGIRLDSGDLAYLSTLARGLLDKAGFTEAIIMASNDLDEFLIEDLKKQGAEITSWGVGTKLVTAFDQPSLGVVYKLTAIKEAGSASWQGKVKLSEQITKTTTPGIHQVRRFYDAGIMTGDMIYDESTPEPPGGWTILDPLDPTRRKNFQKASTQQDLLVEVIRDGECVYESPSIDKMREKLKIELASLHPSVRRFRNPHTYPVGLEANLHEQKTQMVLRMRGF